MVSTDPSRETARRHRPPDLDSVSRFLVAATGLLWALAELLKLYP
jgi:hypothetical protein